MSQRRSGFNPWSWPWPLVALVLTLVIMLVTVVTQSPRSNSDFAKSTPTIALTNPIGPTGPVH